MKLVKMFQYEYHTTFNPKTKIWSGPSRESLYNCKISLGEVILFALSRDPNKIAQISDNSSIRLTNADISQRALKITKWLSKIGCKQNDVIGIVARNSENLAPLALAALLSGSQINTLDVTFPKSEIVHMFSYTKPKFVFCDEDKFDVVKDSLEKLQLNSYIFTLKDSREGEMSIAKVLETYSDEDFRNISLPKIEDGSKQIAFITCSSGTTGLPKGVCLSHAALLHGSRVLDLLANDSLLCFSSLYWLSGVMCLIGGLLSGITRIITEEPFSPENMLRIIDQYKVTMAFNPPSQIALCVQSPDIEKRNLSSIRKMMCGGSEVPQTLRTKMNSYLENGFLSVGYGMTETGVCTVNETNTNLRSVGRLFKNTKARIIDDDGKNLGINERGEILIQPMFSFLGYYGRPEETTKVLDSEGWIHTGDIGYFDEDGYLYVVDRKKDILKYKNFHFTPSEIENVILEVPGVAQVMVCGIPDLVATDLPTALVMRTKDSKVTEAEIYENIASQMADHKHLRGGVYFVESLPMTASGKYIRAKAKEIAIKFYDNRIK